MPKPTKLQVFICHAEQDVRAARELCERLKSEGWIDPWLAADRLLPGQYWRYEIQKNITSADAVIVLFSRTSIKKEGFIQKELRLALDLADEKPDETIYLIPLRIDNCKIPLGIKVSWHYEDYFYPNAERGYAKLLESLKKRKDDIDIRTRSARPPRSTSAPTKSKKLVLELIAPMEPVRFSEPIEWLIRIHNREKAPVRELRLVWGDQILADHFDLAAGEIREFTHSRRYDTSGEHSEKVALLGAGTHQEATAKVLVDPAPSIAASLLPINNPAKQTELVEWVLELMNDGGEELPKILIKRGHTELDKVWSLGIGQSKKVGFTESYDSSGIVREFINLIATTKGNQERTWQVEGEVRIEQVNRNFGEMEFALVPKGKFLMGSKDADEYADDDEKSRHEVEILKNYWIARYPVTNFHFARFIEDSGYRTTAEEQGAGSVFVDSQWKSVAGADWRHPAGIGSDLAGREQHPVVLVSWQDAQEYCRWLNTYYGHGLPANLEFRLPTEAEWEKAARGEDALAYPWGNSHPVADQINAQRVIDDTTQVGQYSPQSDSPYGVADMAGNVWEWTNSIYKAYPYRNDDRQQLSSDLPRVLRGGSFINAFRNARCSARSMAPPDICISYYGFRVVVAARLPDS